MFYIIRPIDLLRKETASQSAFNVELLVALEGKTVWLGTYIEVIQQQQESVITLCSLLERNGVAYLSHNALELLYS